jgi:hypothetical protein
MIFHVSLETSEDDDYFFAHAQTVRRRFNPLHPPLKLRPRRLRPFGPIHPRPRKRISLVHRSLAKRAILKHFLGPLHFS